MEAFPDEAMPHISELIFSTNTLWNPVIYQNTSKNTLGGKRARRAVRFYHISFDKPDFSQDIPQELHDSVARLKSTAPLNYIMVLS